MNCDFISKSQILSVLQQITEKGMAALLACAIYFSIAKLPTFPYFRLKFLSASIRVILDCIGSKTKLHGANSLELPKCNEFKEFRQFQLFLGPL